MNANIDYNSIANKKTMTLNMNLADGPTKTFDLKNTYCMNFKPDGVRPKWILYTSGKNNPYDVTPIITADFLHENRILAPYLARTSITTFVDLEYQTLTNHNYSKAVLQSKAISSDAMEVSYDSGTVLLCLEFVEYDRK